MRKKARSAGILLTLLVSACVPQATPVISRQHVQTPAATATFTVIAQTMTAMPAATLIPPTETVTLNVLPSDTPLPSLTLETAAATSIPQQSSGPAGDACDKLLTSWKGPTANFSIYNETKPEGRIVLSLYVVTPLGECGSLADLSSGPIGSYSARAFVDGKKNFKVYGDFQIKEGTWKIVVRNDKITALGSCYPNC
jgi:hypothetical protein